MTYTEEKLKASLMMHSVKRDLLQNALEMYHAKTGVHPDRKKEVKIYDPIKKCDKYLTETECKSYKRQFARSVEEIESERNILLGVLYDVYRKHKD